MKRLDDALAPASPLASPQAAAPVEMSRDEPAPAEGLPPGGAPAAATTPAPVPAPAPAPAPASAPVPAPRGPPLQRLARAAKPTLAALALLPAVALGIPLQWTILKLAPRAGGIVPVLFHRYVLRVIGVRVTRIGEPDGRRPLLLASNHVSWLDISVLGSLFPLSFVAKGEVAGWPLIGTFARLQRSVFVDRERRHATGAVADEIKRRLDAGVPIVLFAEGTTGDANRVLPFRSALFGAVTPNGRARPAAPSNEAPPASADDGPPAAAEPDRGVVQPMAVVYRTRHGLPLSRRDRPGVAWYGDMDLAPHLSELIRNGPLEVAVRFGAPREVAGADRKALTRAVEAEVRQACALLARGRDGELT